MKKIVLTFTVTMIIIAAIQACNKESNSINKIINAPTNEQLAGKAVSDSGLICYLPFKHNLGDSSGNGNNGKFKDGPVAYVADRFGHARSALSLVGTNTYIEIPEEQIDGLTKGTISLDFYVTEFTGTTQAIISKMSYSVPEGESGFYQSMLLGFGNEGLENPGFEIRANGNCDATPGTGWYDINSDSTIKLNTWNNAIVEFNNTVMKIYINGILTGISTKAASPICSGEPLRLGVWWSEQPCHFNGYLDEFRIYNRTLSVGEIKQLAKQ